ncbi:hypothetical protein [Pseudomonas gingeri]|uniref:Uncharacterized protein n=1 Tax=Pseudomonas gingeri TaxID=117681 RepID=A0A7Y7WFH1_9PSED|nr:hypothetical protein [Pseudomonas gingeri]NWB48246.1 hypothetical protein [Pseudomonas gingeri]
MNMPVKSHTFFIIQVADGRGVFGFQICLTDGDLARELLETFGRDLLGRVTTLHSLERPPETVRDVTVFQSMTQRMKHLMKRCLAEPSPGRAFLVAYVECWRQQMPLSVIASFLEHAKYEPDHDEFTYIPIHQSAIGRAYP